MLISGRIQNQGGECPLWFFCAVPAAYKAAVKPPDGGAGAEAAGIAYQICLYGGGKRSAK